MLFHNKKSIGIELSFRLTSTLKLVCKNRKIKRKQMNHVGLVHKPTKQTRWVEKNPDQPINS